MMSESTGRRKMPTAMIVFRSIARWPALFDLNPAEVERSTEVVEVDHWSYHQHEDSVYKYIGESLPTNLLLIPRRTRHRGVDHRGAWITAEAMSMRSAALIGAQTGQPGVSPKSAQARSPRAKSKSRSCS